ncbi:MAG: PDZ domain-containing protein [Rhodobacterales bacterium]|jgi:hypothetical protein|nr:PDZ domain-containing protein [Rhodobacterales bacterium]
MSNWSNLKLSTSFAIMAGAALLFPALASADIKLPSPYLSRSLDAVLLPIDNSVRNVFGLYAEDTGVFVVSTAPGGVADSYGILPGDVISFIDSRPVTAPVDLDTYVYYWLMQGYTDYLFDLYRGGEYYSYQSSITEELWYETYSYTEISTWSSYSYESFSYEEFYSEYSETIIESYESSESYIEETAMSEEYSSEMTEAYSEESSEETMTEEEMTNEELTREAVEEEQGAADAADDMVEEEVYDDSGEQAVEEESYEEPVAEESYEEPVEEESFEEPVAEESYEEPVEEESYEEPVAEESYEEPVAEESYEESGE